MPNLRPISPEEAQELKSKGIDPSGYTALDDGSTQEQPPEKNGVLSTIGKTSIAHAPSAIGAGLGLAAVAPLTGGMSLIPAALIGAGAAMGGSYLGQKGAETIAPETMSGLEGQAEEARKEHPYIAGATDITESALAGGGSLNLRNLGVAGRQLLGRNALNAADKATLAELGEAGLGPTRTGLAGLSDAGTEAIAGQQESKQALGKIFGSAILNPAINTGLDLATGQPITPGGVASQVIGGALFSEQSRMGKWMTGHGKDVNDEPLPETQSKDVSTAPTELESGDSIFNRKDEQGNYIYPDALVKKDWITKNIIPKDKLKEMTGDDARLASANNWKIWNDSSDVDMRLAMHQADLAEKANTDESGTAKNVNQPTDLQEGAKTASVQASEEPNTTDQNKEKPPVVQVNPTEELDLQQRAALSREAVRQAGGKVSDVSQNPLLPKETSTEEPAKPAASNEQTSTLAADLTAKKASFADAVKAWQQEQMINGVASKHPDVIQAEEKMRAAQQAMTESQKRSDDFQKALIEKNIEETGQNPRPLGTEPPLNENAVKISANDNLLKSDLSKTPGIDEYLASLKTDPTKQWGGFGGIAATVWDGSIDAIRMGIRAGKAIHEAIKDGIAYIKQYHKGTFDEEAYKNKVTEELSNATKERSNSEVIQPEREGVNPNRPSSEASSSNSLQRATKGKEVIPQVNRLGKLGGVVEPLHDRIGEIAHPAARELSAGLKLVDNTKDQYLGESWGKLITFARKIGLNSHDENQLDKISRWENLNHSKAPLTMFTQKQRMMYNMERKIYNDVGRRRIENNEPVIRGGKPTQLQQDPTSHPTPVAGKVMEMYKKGTDVAGIKAADKDFISNAIQHGKTPDQAAKLLSDFKTSIQGTMKTPGSNMSFFGGSRFAQGVSLPESFTKGSYLSRLETYYKRMSLDNAFYKHIESNPKIMAALGETKDAWGRPIEKTAGEGLAGNDNVRLALKHLQGESMDTTDRTEGGWTNLASTLFVSGPHLEVHKLGSNTINGAIALADNPVHATKIFAYTATHLSDGLEHAIEGGLYKPTARSAADFFERGATFAERLQAASQGWRNLSTIGDRTNMLNAASLQAGFEFIIPDKIKAANSGNETTQQLIKKWDPSYTVGKEYSQKEIQNLASVAGAYVHGTKDGRTMPPQMLKDTEISGFLKLAHWSISQTNRFMSDVYTPATKGNYIPLMNALFGSAVGGYVVRQLREELTGKHGNIPDLKEISSSQEGLAGNKGLVAYNLISALQYAGFAGILSQGIKYPIDRMMKNTPQGAVFPLDEIASNLQKQIGDFTSAMANDPNFNMANGAVALVNHILTDNVQLTRIGFNHGVNSGLITGTLADKKILSDKLGQLRRFDMSSNLPYDDQEPAQANQYMNLEQKKFKMEQDIPTAMKELPGLVQNIITTYGDRPDVMMEKLKALKQNAYETMPSLKDKAPSFMKYMNYLTNLKGKDEADSEYMDYMKHKVINEAKASAVP